MIFVFAPGFVTLQQEVVSRKLERQRQQHVIKTGNVATLNWLGIQWCPVWFHTAVMIIVSLQNMASHILAERDGLIIGMFKRAGTGTN